MRTHGYTVVPEQDPQEFDWLLDRVERLAPRRILEIGSRMGAALCAFARTSPVTELAVGVDGFAPGWDCSGAWPLFINKGQILAIKGNSHDPVTVAEARSHAPFDFLFIDADHRYEHAKQDYENYGPMCLHGGMIAFHDITPTMTDVVSVHRLWLELKAKGLKTEEFIAHPEVEMYGIGVVYL